MENLLANVVGKKKEGAQRGQRRREMIIYARPISNPAGINNVVISPQTYFITPLECLRGVKEEGRG